MTSSACRLCEAEVPQLIESHVVPRWVYRRILRYSDDPAKYGVAVGGGRAGFSGKQQTARLLCRPCENLLSTWEEQVALVSLQEDGVTFPALTGALPLAIRGDDMAVRLPDDQAGCLTRYALSVFWRADVSEGAPRIVLDQTRDPIRRCLLGGPLPSEVDILLELLRPKHDTPRVDRVLVPPTEQSGDRPRYVFSACGMLFTLFTDKPHIEGLSLPRNGTALVTDGARLLTGLADALKGATPYGRLATKGPG